MKEKNILLTMVSFVCFQREMFNLLFAFALVLAQNCHPHCLGICLLVVCLVSRNAAGGVVAVAKKYLCESLE